jgi:hypothetical protein
MTLGEGKNKVYMLLDEHSAGGVVEHDQDIEAKLNFFFDIAQKEVAKVQRIVKTRKYNPTQEREEYSLPGDLMGIYRIWRDGKSMGSRYRIRGGKLIIPASDAGREILLEYFAIPETITQDTDDSYEFELREDGCNCLPYYVAAQQLLPDLVMDYSSMLNMYQMALQTLDKSIPGENGRMVQRFFR